MDEMMSANDINMNLAAITPFALLVWLGTKLSKFLFYALLKIGASREETYASLRNTLTDIERLLVMRDNPPSPPALGSPEGGFTPPLTPGGPRAPSVLGSDDLGMLMLLIHECRVILRYNRRRFSDAIIRSVSEDLAELAGERGTFYLYSAELVCSLFLTLCLHDNDVGAVSVQQQLSIVSRMCRTYPFFKVVSTGHMFEFKTIRHVK